MELYFRVGNCVNTVEQVVCISSCFLMVCTHIFSLMVCCIFSGGLINPRRGACDFLGGEGQLKTAKWLYVIYAIPITHCFTKYASKFGGVIWVWGVVKVGGRGGLVKLDDSYFACSKNI